MRTQPGVAEGLVGGLRGLQVGGERDLGIHHDVLAASQPHHQIRTLRSVVGGHADLLIEVTPGDHPGQLDHPPQLHFTPPAARLGPAQRGDQCLGLGPQLIQLSLAMLTCSVRAACDERRAASDSRSWASTLVRVSLSGLTRCSTADRRGSSSPAGLALAACSLPSAISRKRVVLASSACADSAWKRSASCPSTSAVSPAPSARPWSPCPQPPAPAARRRWPGR